MRKPIALALVVNFTSEELVFLRKGCEQFTEKETPAPDDFWVLVEKIYDTQQG